MSKSKMEWNSLLKTLASLNPDLKRLLEKGCALAIDTNCLVVRDIPYLDSAGNLQLGAIVSKLVFENETKVRANNHEVYWAGPRPFGLNGNVIAGLGGGDGQYDLSSHCADVVVKQRFSHKLKDNGQVREYVDHFEKIEHYVEMISGPAMQKFGASPYTFRDCEEEIQETVFKFRDTLTSRAEITDLAKLFTNDVIAIIGLGGSGGYVLDYMVKTPVREIRGFDHDDFFVHNAFRSPGRLDAAELRESKAAIYQKRYENFRDGLKLKALYIDDSTAAELDGVTFAFVCVDKGSSRKKIFDVLIEKGIPFIDVGMGLNRKPGPISGTVRTTYFPGSGGQPVRDRQLAPETDSPDDVYKTNIQIAELNALNGAIAVIRFKQIRGFYVGRESVVHLLLMLDNFNLLDPDED